MRAASARVSDVFKFGTIIFMKLVDKYVGALNEIFKSAPDKHEANYRSRSVLEEMSGDAAFFTEALERHLRTPGALDTKHYPVVGLEIELNAYYGLVANCWIPLPGRQSDISTKSIHHHGNMLLTTVTAFGPGYEHWTFTRPEVIDADAELFEMKLIDRTPHPLHHVAFVDSYIAHLPFYPSETSVTYALWSNKFPVTWKDHVKRLPVLQRNSEKLRSLAVKVGLARQLDLKVVEYFDFYPTPEGFRGIRERNEFKRGPVEDYLYSLFHIIQATGNERLAPVFEELLDKGEAKENPQLVRRLLEDLRSGRRIEGRLSSMHYNIAGANFTRQEAERALAARSAAARRAPVA
jgi:hypothetical protein